MDSRYEMVWPGMDRHMKVFVRHTETAGLLWFEVVIGRRVALCGANTKEWLADFMPKLKTFPRTT